MLSHQIYTQNCNTVYTKVRQCDYKTINGVSSGIPKSRTEKVGVIECPTSQQNKVKQEIHTLETTKYTVSIPIVQYTTQHSNELFDPSIVNTPPSEFITQLKSRLDVYYSTSA